MQKEHVGGGGMKHINCFVFNHCKQKSMKIVSGKWFQKPSFPFITLCLSNFHGNNFKSPNENFIVHTQLSSGNEVL